MTGPVNPLVWQLEAVRLEGGASVVRATFNQGNLAMQLVLSVDDSHALAAQLTQMAVQSSTGLILPPNSRGGPLPPPPGGGS